MIEPAKHITMADALNARNCTRSMCDALTTIPCGPQTFLQRYAVGLACLPATFTGVAKPDDLSEEITFIETTVNGARLRGAQIIHESQADLTPEEQKWIVFFAGNGCTLRHHAEMIQQISKKANCNVRMYDYRGCGYSDGEALRHPQLIEDGKCHVAALLEEGTNPGNIIVLGQSLGGSIAPSVANAFDGVSLMTVNTLSSVSNVALSMAKNGGAFAARFIRKEMTEEFIDCFVWWAQATICLALMPIILVDLATRCATLALHIIYDVLTFDIGELCCDVFDLVVMTPFSDVVIFFISAFGVIVPCLAGKALKAVQNVIRQTSPERSTLHYLTSNSITLWLVQMILYYTDWDIDNTAAWEAFKGKKICFITAEDEVIPLEASLGTTLKELNRERQDIVQMSNYADHCTMPYGEYGNKEEFDRFVGNVFNRPD